MHNAEDGDRSRPSIIHYTGVLQMTSQYGDDFPGPAIKPPPSGVDWANFFSGDLQVKQIGPFFEQSGLAERVRRTGTPFGIPLQYEVDWPALKEWAWAHSFPLSVATLTMGMMYFITKHPEQIAPTIDALGQILKGFGEVIPG